MYLAIGDYKIGCPTQTLPSDAEYAQEVWGFAEAELINARMKGDEEMVRKIKNWMAGRLLNEREN